MWTRRDLKVASFAERLMCEFPDWSSSQAVLAAERIIETAEQMQFQMDVEGWLAELPLIEQ